MLAARKLEREQKPDETDGSGARATKQGVVGRLTTLYLVEFLLSLQFTRGKALRMGTLATHSIHGGRSLLRSRFFLGSLRDIPKNGCEGHYGACGAGGASLPRRRS